MIKRRAIDFLRVFLFAAILLSLSSLFYTYNNFMLETVLFFVILGLGLTIRPLKVLAVLFSFFYFLMFIVFNYNYVFILGLCIIVGLLIYDVIQDRLNIHPWLYVLIPLLILLHIIWFNVLPFGFATSYNLDVGSSQDFNDNNNIYIDQWLGDQEIRSEETGESYRYLNERAIIRIQDSSFDSLNQILYINHSNNSTIEIKQNEKWEIYWDSRLKEYESFSSYSIDNQSLVLFPSLVEDEKLKVYLRKNFSGVDLVNASNETIYKFLTLAKENYSIDTINFELNNLNQEFNFTKNGSFELETDLRGSHKFLVLTNKETLEINLSKKNLSFYEGDEKLNISIYDERDELITSYLFNESESFISTNISGSNKLTVEFKEVNNGTPEDFYIDSISINSPYVMALEQIHLVDNITLYISEEEEENILLYVWRKKAQQNITLKYDNKTSIVRFSEERLGDEVLVEMKEGYLTTEGKEIVIETTGKGFFFNNVTFNPYMFELSENPDIILVKESYHINSSRIDLKSLGAKIYNIELQFKK